MKNSNKKESYARLQLGNSVSLSTSVAFATNEAFLPKSFTWIKQYSLKDFTADLIAGITVGLVALPLAMAFAISSGVAPQAGIYCAIFAGFIISALGGSKTQIGGPTGAFVVVVSAIVAKHGLDDNYDVDVFVDDGANDFNEA